MENGKIAYSLDCLQSPKYLIRIYLVYLKLPLLGLGLVTKIQ